MLLLLFDIFEAVIEKVCKSADSCSPCSRTVLVRSSDGSNRFWMSLGGVRMFGGVVFSYVTCCRDNTNEFLHLDSSQLGAGF